MVNELLKTLTINGVSMDNFTTEVVHKNSNPRRTATASTWMADTPYVITEKGYYLYVALATFLAGTGTGQRRSICEVGAMSEVSYGIKNASMSCAMSFLSKIEDTLPYTVNARVWTDTASQYDFYWAIIRLTDRVGE